MKPKPLPILVIPYSLGSSVGKISPEGSCCFVATGTIAKCWDVKTGQVLPIQLEHDEGITSICFSADSSEVITTSWDKNARIWDLRTGRLIASLGHETRVNSAHFCRNGQRLCTLSDDPQRSLSSSNQATVWDPKNQKILYSTRSVSAAQLSPNGELLLTSAQPFTMDVLDPDECEATICDLEPHSVTEDESLIWNVAPHTITHSVRTLQHGDWVRSARFSSDGSKVVTCCRYSTLIWSTETGQSLKSLDYNRFIDFAEFNADGSRILAEYSDGTAKVWDAITARVIFDIPDSRLSSFSPDGSCVVTACGNDVFQIYRSETGALIGDTIQLGAGLFFLEFSLDGSVLCTTSKDSLSLWNFKDFIALK